MPNYYPSFYGAAEVAKVKGNLYPDRLNRIRALLEDTDRDFYSLFDCENLYQEGIMNEDLNNRIMA